MNPIQDPVAENEEEKEIPVISTGWHGPQITKPQKKFPLVILYIKGFSEQFRMILRGYDIATYPGNTISIGRGAEL